LIDHEELALELLYQHEQKQLDILQQMLESGVEVGMAMDNLDASFHPPYYVEKYSASFYEKASSLCHKYKSKFFIHACGKQKVNLKLISSLGVDGLEGVAYPPLGDVELDEAFQMTHDTFIITGGISAHETENLTNRQQVFEYVKKLFECIKPYANRFMFSASCNTPINTSWETIKHFRDAWLEYGELQ
jgi:uroporphyrinogen-III decarboxylase